MQYSPISWILQHNISLGHLQCSPIWWILQHEISLGHLQYSPISWILQHDISQVICNIHQTGEYCNIYICRTFAIFTNFMNIATLYFPAHLQYSPISWILQHYISQLICNIHQIGEYCNIYIYRTFAIFTNFMNIATWYIPSSFAIFTKSLNIAYTIFPYSISFAIFT